MSHQNRLPYRLFILLCLAAIFQIIHYYPQLPDMLASHFDGAGIPNAWSTKGMYFLLHAAMLLLMVFIALILPLSLERFPIPWISLPNKRHWLSGERRLESLGFLRRHMCWFGVFTLLLMVCVTQLVIRANLAPPPRLPALEMWLLLGGYFIFFSYWLTRIFLRFRKTSMHN